MSDKVKNIDRVSAAIVAKSITKDTKGLVTRLRKLEVLDDKTYAVAVEKLRELKEWDKLALAKEKSVTDLLDKLRNEIQSLFSPFRDTVKTLIAEKKAEMLLYIEKKNKAKSKLEKKFAAGRIGTGKYITQSTQLDTKSAGQRKIWTVIPVDPKKTPREYLVPDMTKIREALKEGKKVAGWSWEQVDNVSI